MDGSSGAPNDMTLFLDTEPLICGLTVCVCVCVGAWGYKYMSPPGARGAVRAGPHADQGSRTMAERPGHNQTNVLKDSSDRVCVCVTVCYCVCVCVCVLDILSHAVSYLSLFIV